MSLELRQPTIKAKICNMIEKFLTRRIEFLERLINKKNSAITIETFCRRVARA